MTNPKAVRFMALALLLLTVCVLALSVVLIAAEADHDCVGEGCAICRQISICARVLRMGGLVILAALAAGACLAGRRVRANAFGFVGPMATLVGLKVRLSD